MMIIELLEIDEDPLFVLGQAYQEFARTGKLTCHLRGQFEKAIRLASELPSDALNRARTALQQLPKSVQADIAIASIDNLLNAPITCRQYYADVLLKAGDKLSALRHIFAIEDLRTTL